MLIIAFAVVVTIVIPRLALRLTSSALTALVIVSIIHIITNKVWVNSCLAKEFGQGITHFGYRHKFYAQFVGLNAFHVAFRQNNAIKA